MRDEHDPAHRQAGHPRRLPVRPDGEHLPSEARAPVDQAEHERDAQHDQHQRRHRHPAELDLRDAEERVRQVAERTGSREDQHPARDQARGGQRHDEAVEVSPDHQRRVAESKARPECERQEHREGGRHTEHLHQPAGEHPRRPSDRADGQVHVADRQHDHLGEADGHGDRRRAQQEEKVEVGGETRREGRKENPEAGRDDQQCEQPERAQEAGAAKLGESSPHGDRARRAHSTFR